MLNEFIDFLKHSKKYGVKIMIRDLININKLYLQSYYIRTILNFARGNKLRFTFFITAKNLKKRRRLVEQIIEDGHEIGSHGYNHILLGNKNYDIIYKELKRADDIFKKNNIIINGFRAPFLSINDEVIKILKDLRYTYSSNRQDNKIKRYSNGIIEKTIISPYDWEAFIVKDIKIDNLFGIWKNQRGVFLMHPWLFVKYLDRFKKEFIKDKKDYRIISKNKTASSFDIY